MQEGSAKTWLTAALVMVAAGCFWPASAGDFSVVVLGNGKPLANAVVSLHPASQTPRLKPATAQMDQRDLQFVPHVLAVTTGTAVRFPNSDNIRHQVYSFSPAKRFDLPLYSGQPAAPVVFGTPGVVELGCNIHDAMLGYIVVLDTPWFGVTGGNGQVSLPLPAGEYRMQVWHEAQRGGPGQPARQTIRVGDAAMSKQIELELSTASVAKPVDARLQQLQDRFRKLKRGD
jgi:plastocyanin